MPLKDWKKVKPTAKHILYIWKNKKLDQSMNIFYWNMDYYKPFEVSGIGFCCGQMVTTVWDKLETKTKALKFARAYMKKH